MCVVIGRLLIDLVMLIDTYRSMIVRFISPLPEVFSHRFFLSLLSHLFTAKENLWDRGSQLVMVTSTY